MSHRSQQNTFPGNSIIRERHDPHSGQASDGGNYNGKKTNSYVEGHDLLFPRTPCKVLDSMDESRITRRLPGFDIQVDPTDVSPCRNQ